VTCGLEERVAEVRERVRPSPYGFAFVTSPHGVLLGRLRRVALEGDGARSAEEAMEPGPSTVRPDTAASELRERLEKRDLKTAVVTRPEGILLGVVRAADLPEA
jgi:Mg/Co/Ni transporter MgtE